MGRKPKIDKKKVERYWWQGYTDSEIAEKLGAKPDRIKHIRYELDLDVNPSKVENDEEIECIGRNLGAFMIDAEETDSAEGSSEAFINMACARCVYPECIDCVGRMQSITKAEFNQAAEIWLEANPQDQERVRAYALKKKFKKAKAETNHKGKKRQTIQASFDKETNKRLASTTNFSEETTKGSIIIKNEFNIEDSKTLTINNKTKNMDKYNSPNFNRSPENPGDLRCYSDKIVERTFFYSRLTLEYLYAG